MPRFTTAVFVTASVSSGGDLDHNEVLGNSAFDIVALKIVPSIIGGTTEAQVYERDTFLTADLLYSTNPFIATGFDPIQKDDAGVITEALRGFIAPYEDQDSTGEFHIKLINNDSQAKTYTITLIYEAVAATSVVNIDDLGDVTITGVASDEVLKWDGANWINNTLAEAGIAADSHVHSAADITTGLLAIDRGGTGQATAGAAFDAFSPVTTLGDIIYRDASNNVRLAGNITTTKQFLNQTGDGAASAAPAWSALVSGDLPSHTHNASDIDAGELPIVRGGTGQSTMTEAFDALAPTTTLGDVSYHDGSDNVRLAGNITTTKLLLSQTGDGAVSAAPVWAALVSGDLPSHTHSAADIDTGVLAVAQGGTALGTTPSNGELLIGDGVDYQLNTLTGTTNEIAVANAAGSITLSLPVAVEITTSLGIGGSVETSAGFELDSTTLAVLLSRMTTGERDSLTAVDGMILYNSSLSQMHARINGAWVDIGGAGSGGVDINGTPVAGQITRWFDVDTIEGDAGFTDDGNRVELRRPFINQMSFIGL